MPDNTHVPGGKKKKGLVMFTSAYTEDAMVTHTRPT